MSVTTKSVLESVQKSRPVSGNTRRSTRHLNAKIDGGSSMLSTTEQENFPQERRSRRSESRPRLGHHRSATGGMHRKRSVSASRERNNKENSVTYMDTENSSPLSLKLPIAPKEKDDTETFRRVRRKTLTGSAIGGGGKQQEKSQHRRRKTTGAGPKQPFVPPIGVTSPTDQHLTPDAPKYGPTLSFSDQVSDRVGQEHGHTRTTSICSFVSANANGERKSILTMDRESVPSAVRNTLYKEQKRLLRNMNLSSSSSGTDFRTTAPSVNSGRPEPCKTLSSKDTLSQHNSQYPSNNPMKRRELRTRESYGKESSMTLKELFSDSEEYETWLKPEVKSPRKNSKSSKKYKNQRSNDYQNDLQTLNESDCSDEMYSHSNDRQNNASILKIVGKNISKLAAGVGKATGKGAKATSKGAKVAGARTASSAKKAKSGATKAASNATKAANRTKTRLLDD